MPVLKKVHVNLTAVKYVYVYLRIISYHQHIYLKLFKKLYM